MTKAISRGLQHRCHPSQRAYIAWLGFDQLQHAILYNPVNLCNSNDMRIHVTEQCYGTIQREFLGNEL